MKRTCETCKWEPVWEIVGYHGNVRGQCRIPNGYRAVKVAKLPPGSHISPPWMDRDKLKKNCPAWAQKDGETE